MAEMISVELNNLRSISTRMQNLISAFTSIDSTLSSITGSMQHVWEGTAQKQYFEDSEELKTALTTFKEQLSGRKSALDQSIAVYERTERTVTGHVADLSAENIF